MTIFEWTFQRLSKYYKIPTNLKNPCEILSYIGAPKSLYQIFDGIIDLDLPLKNCSDGKVPDLESREKTIKRKNGQYYTPEILANQILNEVVNNSKTTQITSVLDPACGDGSFLLAASNHFELNKIFGYDIDKYALLVSAIRLISAFPNKGWPNLKETNFLLEKITNKFGLIIGNPPYKVNLDEKTKNYLLTNYQTTEGEKDLYTFFMEKSIDSLENKGILAMLTSHTWLVNHQCKKIRNFIFSNTKVKSLYILPQKFFLAAPTIIPVITLCKKNKNINEYDVNIYSAYSQNIGWNIKTQASSSSLINGNGLRESVIPNNLKPFFYQMEKSTVKLGDVCHIGVGIQESLKKEGKSSKYVFEEQLNQDYKPVVKGRDISQFKVNWDNKYIYFGKHLAYMGNENIYKAPKILYQNIRNEKLTKRIVATLDRKGFYPKNSLSFIVSNNSDYSLELIVGLLNSLLVNAWFSSKNHSFHITVTQIKEIPLPPVNIILFKQIEEISNKLLKLKPDTARWNKLLEELNILVLKSYLGVVYDERGLLESLLNFLEEAASL